MRLAEAATAGTAVVLLACALLGGASRLSGLILALVAGAFAWRGASGAARRGGDGGAALVIRF